MFYFWFLVLDLCDTYCFYCCGIWCISSAEHDIFGEVSSSDDEVNILDSGDEVSGPVGFRPDDVKDSLDLGFAEAAATLDPDVCKLLLTNITVGSPGMLWFLLVIFCWFLLRMVCIA